MKHTFPDRECECFNKEGAGPAGASNPRDLGTLRERKRTRMGDDYPRYRICPDSSYYHGCMSEDEIRQMSRYLESQVANEGRAIIPPDWLVSFQLTPDGEEYFQHFELGGVFYRIHENMQIDL